MVTKRSDAEIRRDVIREQAWDKQIGHVPIGVSVTDRVVTLSGVVDTWTEKELAQAVAHRVVDVLDVANEIEIRRPKPAHSDSEIAHAVRDALIKDVFVPDDRIHLTVTDGIVTLAGTVDSQRQREEVGRIVRDVAGVFRVADELIVHPPALAEDQLRASIEAALHRHAEREARKITIHVRGNAVTLRGTVGSWAERTAIVGIARGTDGVKVVDDHLHVMP